MFHSYCCFTDNFTWTRKAEEEHCWANCAGCSAENEAEYSVSFDGFCYCLIHLLLKKIIKPSKFYDIKKKSIPLSFDEFFQSYDSKNYQNYYGLCWAKLRTAAERKMVAWKMSTVIVAGKGINRARSTNHDQKAEITTQPALFWGLLFHTWELAENVSDHLITQARVVILKKILFLHFCITLLLLDW